MESNKPATDLDLSGRSLGEFVLREKIGEGGYGVVYRCEQPTLRRQAVVKILRRQDPIARDRFLREAQLSSRFEHPYAAHVYAFGAEIDGLLWIAMELVPGITLKDWIDTNGPMPLEQFVPLFECIAEVVQAAHDHGIVHRDLKPSNIMVASRSERLVPKLLDFGIAKSNEPDSIDLPDRSVVGLGLMIGLGRGSEQCESRDVLAVNDPSVALGEVTRTASEPMVLYASPPREMGITSHADPSFHQALTRTGIGIGSRAYMSPEQWSNAAAVGPSTDIYSLGIIAYQVLTGRVPFRADCTREYFQHHMLTEAPSLGPGFPPEVTKVIRRALSKDPHVRQRSALELASELRAAFHAQPGEQLRSLARVWHAHARPAALLLKGGDLLRTPGEASSELERAFVSASRRHAARQARFRRSLIIAALALVALWYRGRLKAEQQAELAMQQARSAQQIADAIATQFEIEQGRSALLHNEPGASIHLAKAYRRAPSPSTAFMLARALQPSLAEQAQKTL